MIEDFIIIGGGVAGLAAANRLADKGASPLLITADSYPSHKVCGEVFSSESFPYLQLLDIKEGTPITQTYFHVKGHAPLSFSFCGKGLSHFVFDSLLLNKALSKKARVQTNCKVEKIIEPKKKRDHYIIYLDDERVVKCKNLIIASPKLNPFTSQPKYIGFKTHFKGIDLKNTLRMFSFKGGYLGIAPIENNRVNIAAIVEKKYWKADAKKHFKDLCKENKDFNSLIKNGKSLFPWLCCSLPEFGVRKTPSWINSYFIGDAIASIPPVSGLGQTFALFSGIKAAEYALKGEFEAFDRDWKKRCCSSIFWTKKIHFFVKKPTLCKFLANGVSLFPALSKHLYRLTRNSFN